MNKKALLTTALASTVAASSLFGVIGNEPQQAQASTQQAYKTTQYVSSPDGVLNVRKSASVKAGKVASLKNGTKVVTQFKKKVGSSTWVYGTANGKTGWMNASYLSSKKATTKVSVTVSGSRSATISYGQKFTGVRYVWGGTTPSGFDCSGFTKYVYKNALGKSLPRTSAAQYAASKKISKSEAQPGDLVFFSAGGGRVTHVGIYAGNDRILHASTSKGVNLGTINDGYWNKRLVGFGRP